MQLNIGIQWHIWIIIYVNKDRYIDMQCIMYIYMMWVQIKVGVSSIN